MDHNLLILKMLSCLRIYADKPHVIQKWALYNDIQIYSISRALSRYFSHQCSQRINTDFSYNIRLYYAVNSRPYLIFKVLDKTISLCYTIFNAVYTLCGLCGTSSGQVQSHAADGICFCAFRFVCIHNSI